ASAVFRCGEGWCAFVVEDGRARRREVELGQRNALQAQVLKGLAEGESVVRYPANDLDDGARVQAGVSSPR
ncbi:MAG: efflux transporter periplasmic adaptor subunit, partial [Gammaproteobacteria bacterium]